MARITRRRFIQTGSFGAAAFAGQGIWANEATPQESAPLTEFNDGNVLMSSDLHEAQTQEYALSADELERG